MIYRLVDKGNTGENLGLTRIGIPPPVVRVNRKILYTLKTTRISCIAEFTSSYTANRIKVLFRKISVEMFSNKLYQPEQISFTK